MNRCRIYKPFLHKVLAMIDKKLTPQNYYDYNKKERKIFQFIEKWGLTRKNGKLYHQNKQVVPYEDTEDILKREATGGGMPLSRDGAMAFLGKRYVGFKKNMVMDWLKRVEQLQLIHRRTDVPRAKPARKREGATNWRMSSANEGRMNIGVDLFDIPREWSAYKYFFVAVLQKSGFTWLVPMKNKKAKTARTCLKQVFADCKKRFGAEPSGVTSDKGGEFLAEFGRWLAGRGVKQKFEKKLCSWVEKKNSSMARTFAVMRQIHGFKKSLELTLEKINNTVSRKTRKAPGDWTAEDFTKKIPRYNRKIKANPRRRIAVALEKGDRVRLMLKKAIDKGGFYKSYEGMRKKSHYNWSRKIYRVTNVKKGSEGFPHKYKIDKDDDWIPHRELQHISGRLVRLKPKDTEKKRKKPKKPVMRALSAPILRRSKRLMSKQVLLPPAAPIKRQKLAKAKKAQSAPVLRRSTRVRRAPVRYGFS